MNHLTVPVAQVAAASEFGIEGVEMVHRMRCLVAVVSLAVLSACGGSNGSTGPVNFGVIAGFSGPAISYATLLRNGVAVAVKLINDNGGVNGRQVALIARDDGFDPVDAVTVTRQMLATDNIKVLIGYVGLDYSNALPIVNQNKMVDFNIVGDPSVDKSLPPYAYALGPSDALNGAAMVLEASRRGFKKIALVFDATLGAQTLVPAAKFAAAKLGIQIVSTPVVPSTAISYEAEISQVIQSNPDAVLMQIETTQVGAFFNEWKTLGATKIPIITSDYSVTSATWAVAAGADEVNNHIEGVGAVTDIGGPGGTIFTTTYDSLYHTAFGGAATYGYDGATVAALAMTEAKSVDPVVYQPFVDDVTMLAADHEACYTFATCQELLKAGKKIKYYGLGSPMVYNQNHRVAADFGVYRLSATANGQVQLQTTIKGADLVGLY